MAEQLKTGDVVFLKSNPVVLMTVECKHADRPTLIRCQWFDRDSKLHVGDFQAAALTKKAD